MRKTLENGNSSDGVELTGKVIISGKEKLIDTEKYELKTLNEINFNQGEKIVFHLSVNQNCSIVLNSSELKLKPLGSLIIFPILSRINCYYHVGE